jgi:hypothetical protein
MFKKACPYDEQTLFYFDFGDHKHLARGGSLAWRLNNPGLIASHSPFAKRKGSIGSYAQYAIFPCVTRGVEALRAWLLSTKWYRSPLRELSKHYRSEDPDAHLKQLTALTRLVPEKQLCSLSKCDFENVVRAIQVLCGFQQALYGEWRLLPKITARFSCNNPKTDLYLCGYEELLDKEEAMQRVASHQLDAVIVRRNNGEAYLRSRPRHHLNRICLSERDCDVGGGWDDAMRAVGVKKEKQCIWGFVNGIGNSPEQARQSASLISDYARGERVWSLVNDSNWYGVDNLIDVARQKLGLRTKVVERAVHYLKLLLTFSFRDAACFPVVIIAHSQGALIVDLALDRLTPEEREQLHVFTFGGASFLAPGKAHVQSHNYVSLADPVPRLSSLQMSDFLFKLYAAKASPQTAIEALVQDDVNSYLDSNAVGEDAPFRAVRRAYYEELLRRMQNITVLDHDLSGIWEHSFATSCYQNKVKETVEAYQRIVRG